MAQETSSKMITLKIANEILFEVEANIAKEMQTLHDKHGDTAVITLPNVLSKHLAMVIKYCKTQGVEEAEIRKEFSWAYDHNTMTASKKMRIV